MVRFSNCHQMPVTNNSLSEDYSHLDDHSRQTTDTPGFKPFTNSLSEDYSHPDDHTRQTTDTPGFKPFTNSLPEDYSQPDDHTSQTTDTPGFKPFTSDNNVYTNDKSRQDWYSTSWIAVGSCPCTILHIITCSKRVN